MSVSPSFQDLLKQADARRPDVALILGSGMQKLTDGCGISIRVPFTELPELAAPSVPGHAGWLALGIWGGQQVLLFEGRLHFYEGCSWNQVVQPVVLAHSLGARCVILTNAAGGIRPDLGPGSFLAIRDHVEWTWPDSWRRPRPGAGPSPYSERLLGALREAASDSGLNLSTGVYAAVTGPCYETPAEIRALARCGADAVGMSTAREIRTAHELGLECAALSCITNHAAGLGAGPIHHEEVLATAAVQSERLGLLLQAFLQRI
jgi:purine-nucleoside phosphorylase